MPKIWRRSILTQLAGMFEALLMVSFLFDRCSRKSQLAVGRVARWIGADCGAAPCRISPGCWKSRFHGCVAMLTRFVETTRRLMTLSKIAFVGPGRRAISFSPAPICALGSSRSCTTCSKRGAERRAWWRASSIEVRDNLDEFINGIRSALPFHRRCLCRVIKTGDDLVTACSLAMFARSRCGEFQ